MTLLRAKSIKDIESILYSSYFTKDSFTVTNNSDEEPFLVISFIPIDSFYLEVEANNNDKGHFYTTEAPGLHIASAVKNNRSNFPEVKKAIQSWTNRIKEDLDSGENTDEIDNHLNKLRASFESHSHDKGKFSIEEIKNLKEKIDALEDLLVKQAEKIEASEGEIEKFRSEFESIKNDLPKFQKGVWYTISGNKVIKATKDFIITPEGRKLIADSFKKLLE